MSADLVEVPAQPLARDHAVGPLSRQLPVHDRAGRRELQVEPLVNGSLGQLLLSSDGRSRYREAEVGMHYTVGSRVDVNAWLKTWREQAKIYQEQSRRFWLYQ